MFPVEYVVRVWTARARLRYARSPMAVIGLLAVLPFCLPYMDLRVPRLVRMFRLLRIAKLARYSTALQTLGRVVAAK